MARVLYELNVLQVLLTQRVFEARDFIANKLIAEDVP